MGELNLPELEAMRRQMESMTAEIKRLADRLNTEPREPWTTEQVARHYGVTAKTVRAYANEGKLTFRRIGAKMAFDPDDLPETLR